MTTLLMKIVAAARAIAPYAAIELLLPGGSLIALLFWIYRTRQRRRGVTQEAGLSLRPLSTVTATTHLRSWGLGMVGMVLGRPCNRARSILRPS